MGQARGWSAWRATAAAAAAAASGSPRYSADRTARSSSSCMRKGMPVGTSSSVISSSGIALQVLAQGPDGIAVGGDQHRTAVGGGRAQVGHDGRLPVRHHALHDVFQALGAREVGRGEIAVARVARHVVGVVGGERRGRGVVAAAPELELPGPEFLLDGGFVLALQVSVVPLVEAPVAADGQPGAPRRGQGQLGRPDGPGQDRSVEEAQVQAVDGGQELAAGPGLGLPGRGQIDVDPPREEVLGVPGGLPMADQDQIEHTSSVGGPGGEMETTSSRPV